MQNRTREIALRRADRTTLRGSCGGRPHNEHASADRSKKAATEILRRLCPKRERPVYFVMAQTMTKMLHVAEIEMRL